MLSDGTFEALPQTQCNDMNQCVFEKMIPGTEEGITPAVRCCARGTLFDNFGRKQFIDVAEGRLSLDDFMEQLSDDDLIHLLGGQPNMGVANTFGFGNLPDYGVGDENMLVMADVSGSMYGRPMATSVGLAIYFAERNKGDYHNRFMTFSALPSIVHLEGETLAEKVACAVEADWGLNTNLEAAFDSILKTAVENHVPEEEMPKSLIIISDMEFDSATYDSDWLFYETMKKKFKRNGYTIPNVVFWNVDSRHNAFHADKKREGVQLLSGSAVTIFEHLDEGIGMTPVEMMRKIIEDERYACITIAEAV